MNENESKSLLEVVEKSADLIRAIDEAVPHAATSGRLVTRLVRLRGETVTAVRRIVELNALAIKEIEENSKYSFDEMVAIIEVDFTELGFSGTIPWEEVKEELDL